MNDELKIEKGMPVPPRYTKRSQLRTVVQSMEKGDSVFVGDLETPNRKKRIRSFLNQYGAANNILFITRSEGNGIRFWRTH